MQTRIKKLPSTAACSLSSLSPFKMPGFGEPSGPTFLKIGRLFINQPIEKDRLYHKINKLAKAQRISERRISHIAKRYNKNGTFCPQSKFNM
jgi:hypothetical protein